MDNKMKSVFEAKNKTAYRVAKDTKIATRTIYDMIERDDIDSCRYGLLRKVAAALGVEIEDLRGPNEKPA